MITITYLYRCGDGNDGNRARFLVELSEADNPYAALRALVPNDYIAGRKVRRHIIREITVDGEAEYGLHATVYQGPNGEEAFGAAWITAELQPVTAEDLAYRIDSGLQVYPLRKVLDNGALRQYRTEIKANA